MQCVGAETLLIISIAVLAVVESAATLFILIRAESRRIQRQVIALEASYNEVARANRAYCHAAERHAVLMTALWLQTGGVIQIEWEQHQW